MRGKVPLGLAAWSVLAGCEAFVVKPDVTSAQGEHYVELQCPSGQDACQALARKQCKGGFESPPTSIRSEYLLVQCKPYVVGTDIIGPHGEHLLELECPSSAKKCLDFARKTCEGGDYDIFSTSPMLIQCQRAPPAPDAPPPGPGGPVPPPPAFSPPAPPSVGT